MVSRAKLVLAIVYFRAREHNLALCDFTAFFKEHGRTGTCPCDTYKTMLGFAECLDNEWVQGNSSNWLKWVDGLRDSYFGNRKRPAVVESSPP